MQLNLLKAKIHHATVTQSDLNYEGSISIDVNLLKAANILVNEKVDVLNINNGERFTTYAIAAKANSGQIQVNGAAARKVQVGDLLIIISYAIMSQEEAAQFTPTVVLLNKKIRFCHLKLHTKTDFLKKILAQTFREQQFKIT